MDRYNRRNPNPTRSGPRNDSGSINMRRVCHIEEEMEEEGNHNI